MLFCMPEHCTPQAMATCSAWKYKQASDKDWLSKVEELQSLCRDSSHKVAEFTDFHTTIKSVRLGLKKDKMSMRRAESYKRNRLGRQLKAAGFPDILCKKLSQASYENAGKVQLGDLGSKFDAPILLGPDAPFTIRD